MADAENQAFLPIGNEEGPVPVSKKTKNLSYVAFGVCGFILFINLISYDFFAKLIYDIFALYLAYRIFAFQVMERAAHTSIGRDVGQAYLACGLIPATALFFVSSGLLSVLFYMFIALLLFLVKPSWLTDIFDSGKALSGHGNILVDGVLVTDIGTQVKHLSKLDSRETLAHVSRAVANVFHRSSISHLSKLQSRDVLSHVSRAVVAAAQPNSSVYPDMPTVQFEDGTEALPYIADFMRKLSGIPVILLLFVGLVSAFVLKALTQEHTKLVFTSKYAMKRDGASLRSVTASAMAVGLGIAVMTSIVLSGGPIGGVVPALVVGIFFWVYAAFQVATAAMIGVTKFENEQATDPSSKKYVLAMPVLLFGLSNFLPFILLIFFLKGTLPVIANALTEGSGYAGDMSGLYVFLAAIVPLMIAQGCVIVFAIRHAIHLFRDAVTVI